MIAYRLETLHRVDSVSFCRSVKMPRGFEIDRCVSNYTEFRCNDEVARIEIFTNGWKPVKELLYVIDFRGDENRGRFLDIEELLPRRVKRSRIEEEPKWMTGIVLMEDFQITFDVFNLLQSYGAMVLPICRLQEAPETWTIPLSTHQIGLLNDDCWLEIFSHCDLESMFEVSAVHPKIPQIVRQDSRVKKLTKIDFIFHSHFVKTVSKMTRVLNCLGPILTEIQLTIWPGRLEFNEFKIVIAMTQLIGGKLQTLRLTNFRWLPLLFELIDRPVFNQITALQLDCCFDTVIDVELISRRFPNLEKLELQNNWILINNASRSSKLTELRLSRGASIVKWSSIVKHFQDVALTSFNVETFSKQWHSFGMDVSSTFRNLRELSALYLPKESLSVEQIVRLLEIKSLRVLNVKVIEIECLEVLLQMTHLTDLSMDYHCEVSLPDIADRLPKLKRLRIWTSLHDLSKRDLLDFIARARNLILLHFHYCNSIRINSKFVEQLLDARKQSQVEMDMMQQLSFSCDGFRWEGDSFQVSSFAFE